jgi:hypothetical protein
MAEGGRSAGFCDSQDGSVVAFRCDPITVILFVDIFHERHEQIETKPIRRDQ